MKWVLLILMACVIPMTSEAQSITAAHTEVSLLSEARAVKPGDSFWVGVRMRMEDKWHVYWRNPGDSGLAPEIKWTLPEGWKADPIQWPTPIRIDVPPLTAYGYDKEVIFLVKIKTSPQTSLSSTLPVQADVTWLACQIDCIPGKGTLIQPLTTAEVTELDPIVSGDFVKARQLIPHEQCPWKVNANLLPKQWQITIAATDTPEHAQFFPFRNDIMLHASPQIFSLISSGFNLIIPKSNLLTIIPKEIEGLITVDGISCKATIPVSAVAAIDPQVNVTLWLACLFAFIGGLILNIMPCVLPVLSLKVIALAQHRYSRRESLLHGGVFAAGVIISFVLLALILVLVQNAGTHIGWGFQFQSPAVVAGMALLFIVLALNLFGVFEIGTQFTTLGSVAQSARGLKSSFLNGLLATLVATPCTAPFMGTAIAYALTQSPLYVLIVFTCLGFGMALPMLTLSAFPSLFKFIPKPGPWMNTLKRIMGILMLVSALWLVWVLNVQLGTRATSNQWKKFTPQLIEQYQKEGKAYFLDFTAAWCLTCQVNDRLVLQHPKVVENFKKKNIILIKADWTTYDPAITQALSQRGRQSIPLYVYYNSAQGIEEILGESITVKGLIDQLH